MPFICPSMQNIDLNCLNNVGSLLGKIYVFPSKTRTKLVIDQQTGVVSEAEYSDSGAVLPISVAFAKDTATFTENRTYTKAIENANNIPSLSITVNKRSHSNSRKIEVIGQNSELDVYFVQANGIVWFMQDTVLETVASTIGATRAEGSNYVLTFTGDVDELIY